jgi:hypothetical protein
MFPGSRVNYIYTWKKITENKLQMKQVKCSSTRIPASDSVTDGCHHDFNISTKPELPEPNFAWKQQT